MQSRDQRGQSSAEYIGILLVVVVLIGAIVSFGIAGTITDKIQAALCSLTGTQCEKAGPGADGNTPEQLAAREQALTDMAGRGATFDQLLAEARAARERGDLAEADRILDRLELYKRLMAANRGDLVGSLASGSDSQFDALVARGTIDGDGSNRRYFHIKPSPGDGVIAMDYFIPGSKSVFLKGDHRGTQDPLLGKYGLDRSRIVVVIDRESGRGVIYQSQTCTVKAPVVGAYCQAPRPIALRPPKSEPQILPSSPNEFDVKTDGGSIQLDYDALNSITPGALSVDGSVRLEPGPDGFLHVTKDTRDKYPRIVTSQYRPGKGDKIIDETKDKPVLEGATPPILRPSCDNPILKVNPFLC